MRYPLRRYAKPCSFGSLMRGVCLPIFIVELLMGSGRTLGGSG